MSASAQRIVVNGAANAGFGAMLRGWRRNRRQSQLDLALNAEVSQRHVSFIESGRSRPSRAMVLRLAEALEVPVRERNHLLQAAGFAAGFRERGLDDADMAPVKQALDLLLAHHEPYPALVVDHDWNLVLANTALHRVFGLLGDMEQIWQAVCGEGPRNVMRLTFHPAGMRGVITNWDQCAPALLHRLSREAAATASPVLTALLAELRADPEIPSAWAEPALGEPLAPVLPVRLERDGLEIALFTMISTFGTPQDITTDELRVEAFFPADEASAQLLRALAPQAATPGSRNRLAQAMS